MGSDKNEYKHAYTELYRPIKLTINKINTDKIRVDEAVKTISSMCNVEESKLFEAVKKWIEEEPEVLNFDAEFAEKEKMRASYDIPRICEKCGSEKIKLKAYYDLGVVAYTCLECGLYRQLPKDENLTKRTNTSLEKWAKTVKTRDKCCKICGCKNDLEAHHIIPVAHSEKYKYNNNNGIALCKSCHYLVHNKEEV